MMHYSISYDAASKTLTAGYDPVPSDGIERFISLGSKSAITPYTQLTGNDFRAYLIGEGSGSATMGGMYFDDFLARPQELTFVPEPTLAAWLCLVPLIRRLSPVPCSEQWRV
jgi:hypothetical protein